MRWGRKIGMREPMRTNWMCGIARRRVRILSSRSSEKSRGSPPESRTSRTCGVLFKVFEGRFPLGFQMLLADAGNDARAGAIAAVGGAAVGDEKQHAVRIAVDEAGHRHVGILAAGIGEFLGRVPAFLDARDDLAADRAIRIVAVDQVEKVRGDRHRQLVPGEQDAGALDIGEVEARFEIGEGIHAVAELPFVVAPVVSSIPVASIRERGR